jgi:hypothetical protein
VLERDWSVKLVAAPASSDVSGSTHVGRSLGSKVANFVHSSILLDKFELWSLRRLRAAHRGVSGALLIGFPYSPVAYAARHCIRHGIPYVVDMGDPWVLTADRPLVRGLGRYRARRAERDLWANADGAIVTTERQARELRQIAPQLDVLVRPNGYSAAEVGSGARRDRARFLGSVLRLAHFGELSSVRVPVEPLLAAIARSGRWHHVEFHQYGSDWTGRLRAQRDVGVVVHSPRPWPEIVDLASRYDAAIVIANRDPKQLPSKTIDYLQLPIPRVAVVGDEASDSVVDYVADKPGWITVRADGGDAADRIAKHISRLWAPADLRPPSSESWESVAASVAAFVERTLRHRAESRQ